jgi:hypothetical protein
LLDFVRIELGSAVSGNGIGRRAVTSLSCSSPRVRTIGGDRIAEIDGAYFGGDIRPENLAVDRIDRRLA